MCCCCCCCCFLLIASWYCCYYWCSIIFPCFCFQFSTHRNDMAIFGYPLCQYLSRILHTQNAFFNYIKSLSVVIYIYNAHRFRVASSNRLHLLFVIATLNAIFHPILNSHSSTNATPGFHFQLFHSASISPRSLCSYRRFAMASILPSLFCCEYVRCCCCDNAPVTKFDFDLVIVSEESIRTNSQRTPTTYNTYALQRTMGSGGSENLFQL